MQWQDQQRIPLPVRAVLAFLRMDEVAPPSLSDSEWKLALQWCDRFQLTLLLGAKAGGFLPG